MSFTALAAVLPADKEQFCERFGTTQRSRETIQDLSGEVSNLMAFKNNGGLLNGGVCWWHSRFQRNILYLSIFRPEMPRPTSNKEIQNIIHEIRLGRNVITIPGYANFAEFSKLNQALIQKELNDWQLYDGIVLGGWMDGLKGDTKVPAATLERMISNIHQYVSVNKKIAYTKLQIKGITSHAWLVVGMKQMPSGFDLGFIDSNNPRMTEIYSYKTGDESFFIKGYGNFVPYLEFTREEEKLINYAKVFCGIKNIAQMPTARDEEKNYQTDLMEARNIQ